MNCTFRLSLMMFFQYMMYAVWWVPLAAYLTNLHLGSMEKSMILSSMAIGCLASPVIGMIADRSFDSKKVLSFINIFSSVLLLFARSQSIESRLRMMIPFNQTYSITKSIDLWIKPLSI